MASVVREDTLRAAVWALKAALHVELRSGGRLALVDDQNGLELEEPDLGRVALAMARELEAEPGRTLDLEALDVVAHAQHLDNRPGPGRAGPRAPAG